MESDCRRGASAEQSAWSYSWAAECKPMRVKDEPTWGECGMSEAAAAEHLYAEHEVKDELVIGPEQIQQQDIALYDRAAPSTVKQECRGAATAGSEDSCASSECSGEYLKEEPAAPAGCNAELLMFMLRPCTVRLERARVDEYCTSTPRAPPRPRSHNDTHEPDWTSAVRPVPADTHAQQEMLACDKSSAQFTQKHKLVSHVGTCASQIWQGSKTPTPSRSSTKEKPFSCNRCPEQFVSKARLAAHSRACPRDAGQPPNRCDACAGLTELSRRELIRIPCTEKKVLSCDTCGKKYLEKKIHLGEHKTHTTKNSYCCDTCGKAFKQKGHLVDHMRSHTGERPYGCDVCQKRYIHQSNLRRHKVTHPPDAMISTLFCNTCNKCFSTKSSLVAHMRSHKKTYGCGTCGKTFSRHSTIASHMRCHTGEKPYSCDVCQKRFTQKTHLTRHKAIHLPDALRRSFSCDICNKNFSFNSDLVVHMRSHTGEQPYGCDVCQKRFTHKNYLTRHKATHLPDAMRRSFSCDICNKNFSCKVYLVVHMRSHTGEQPYGCHVCQERFTQKSNLTRHKAIHLPNAMRRSISCYICNKNFSRKYTLVLHMRSHTGGKPYGCDVCRKRFTHKSSLTHHKATHLPDAMRRT